MPRSVAPRSPAPSSPTPRTAPTTPTSASAPPGAGNGASVPPHGISARALRAWWDHFEKELRRFRELRAAPSEHENCPDCHRRRYAFKVEMKAAEANLRWLHEIVAPPGARLCEGDCPHLARGATAEQCQALLARLQRDIDQAETYLRTHCDAEWRQDELDSSRAAKRLLLELLANPELNPPPAPAAPAAAEPRGTPAPATAEPRGTPAPDPATGADPAAAAADRLVREAVEAAQAALRARGLELDVGVGANKRPRPYGNAEVTIAEGARLLSVYGLAEPQALLFVLSVGFGEGIEPTCERLETINEDAGDEEHLLHVAVVDGMLAIRAAIRLTEPWDANAIVALYDRMADLCGRVADEFGPAPADSPAVRNYRPEADDPATRRGIIICYGKKPS
jgi:hypothetical protein